MPRWVGPLALAAVVLVAGTLGWVHQSSASGRVVTPPATSILDARRLPTGVAGLVASDRLAQRLGPVVGNRDLCMEVSVGGKVVFDAGGSRVLVPASNLKLLTAEVALQRLGPGTRLTTAAVAANPARDGVVAGPLYLVGGGDPLLGTAAWRPSQSEWTEAKEPVTNVEALADRIRAAGVRAVTGGIVGDDSRYDAQRVVPTWSPSYLSSGAIGPVGALEVDGGTVLAGGHRTAVADPALAAAQALQAALVARGVRVDGAPATGRAPVATGAIASIDSVPVSDLVGEMLRESDNLTAEMLTKELGYRAGNGGTWAGGLQVIRDTLTGDHVPLDGLVQVDGSGLDRGDRASCDTLRAVLATADPDLAAGLPTAGDCGTLVGRFKSGPAAGRIRAKTGSLVGVAALSGYVIARPADIAPPCPPGGSTPDPQLTFVLLVNNLGSTAAATAIEDSVAAALATYPESPNLPSVGP